MSELEEACATMLAISESPARQLKHQWVGNYKLSYILGEGSFGVVYEACHRNGKYRVAVKVLDLKHNTFDRQSVEAEINSNTRLLNHHVVRMHFWTKVTPPSCSVLLFSQ